MGWDWTFALMRYGPRWKEHRRVFHTHFNHSVAEHQQVQLDISKELLTLLLKSPENCLEHMRQYAWICLALHHSISLSLSYTAHIIMKRV
jgi:hypothetical protein